MTTSVSLAIYLALITGTAGGILVLSHFLGRRPLTAEKTVPYECGMDGIDRPTTLFAIKFYIIALVFVIFHVETVFVYLWAVVVRDLGFYGWVAMLIFIEILLLPFVYMWKKGALKWE